MKGTNMTGMLIIMAITGIIYRCVNINIVKVLDLSHIIRLHMSL